MGRKKTKTIDELEALDINRKGTEMNDWRVWRNKSEDQEPLGFDTTSENPDSKNEIEDPQNINTGKKLMLTSPKLKIRQSRIQKYLHPTKKIRTVQSPRMKAVQSPQSPRNFDKKIATIPEAEVISSPSIKQIFIFVRPDVDEREESIDVVECLKAE